MRNLYKFNIFCNFAGRFRRGWSIGTIPHPFGIKNHIDFSSVRVAESGRWRVAGSSNQICWKMPLLADGYFFARFVITFKIGCKGTKKYRTLQISNAFSKR